MSAHSSKDWPSRIFALGCIVLVLCSMILAPSAFSQTAATGALTGTLRDSSGAVVPNATVTATSTGTGQARTTKTEA